MGYGRQYFRHTLITSTATIINGILLYLLRVVLYQKLGPEDYGLFYAVISFAMLAQPVLALGLDYGIVPYVTRFREENDFGSIRDALLGAVALQLVAGAALAAAATIFAKPVALAWFGASRAACLVIVVATASVLVAPFKTGSGVFLGLQHIGTRNIAELMRSATFLGLVAALLYAGLGVKAAALGYAGSVLAGLAVQAAVLRLRSPAVFRPPIHWRPRLIWDIFNCGKYLALAFGGILVFSHMDTIMLTLIRGDLRSVAAYQLAFPSMMVLYAPIFAAASNFMPMAATLWHRGEKALLADGLQRIYEAATVIILPASVLVACFCDVLMENLFQKDILNAPDAFVILAIGSIFYFACLMNLHVLAGIGRTSRAGLAVAVALGANLVLNLALIYPFGIRGAAAATVLSHALVVLISTAAVRKLLDLRYRAGVACATSLGCLASAALCLLTRSTELFKTHRIGVAVGVSLVLYVGLVALLEISGFGRLRELLSVVIRGRTRSPRA